MSNAEAKNKGIHLPFIPITLPNKSGPNNSPTPQPKSTQSALTATATKSNQKQVPDNKSAPAVKLEQKNVPVSGKNQGKVNSGTAAKQVEQKKPVTPSANTITPPTKTTTPLSKTIVLPAKTNAPPTKTTASPAKTIVPPAKTIAPPTKTTAPPAKTIVSPVKTTAPPVKTSAPLKKTTAPPTKIIAPPTKTIASAVKTTALPAKTTAPSTKTTVPPAKTIAPPKTQENKISIKDIEQKVNVGVQPAFRQKRLPPNKSHLRDKPLDVNESIVSKKLDFESISECFQAGTDPVDGDYLMHITPEEFKLLQPYIIKEVEDTDIRHIPFDKEEAELIKHFLPEGKPSDIPKTLPKRPQTPVRSETPPPDVPVTQNVYTPVLPDDPSNIEDELAKAGKDLQYQINHVGKNLQLLE